MHLAWAFHPARRPDETWRTNVLGSRRVLDAADRAGVAHMLVVSSVAAYSQRLDLDPVDERWPTDGASEAPYAREKAYVERLLDTFEATHPSVVLTRMRPVFVFQASAAEEQRRIFAGVWRQRDWRSGQRRWRSRSRRASPCKPCMPTTWLLRSSRPWTGARAGSSTSPATASCAAASCSRSSADVRSSCRLRCSGR